MNDKDDAPFGVFRASYTLATWLGFAMMVAIVYWLAVVLLRESPPGTVGAQRLAAVQPTHTALYELVPSPTAGPLAELLPICASCHQVYGQGGIACPDLSTVAAIAAARIADPDYAGQATTAEEYLIESISDPNAYIVPEYDSPSTMPPWGGVPALEHDSALLEALIGYLMTLD